VDRQHEVFVTLRVTHLASSTEAPSATVADWKHSILMGGGRVQ
jgi:hypothetical protein